MTGHSVSPVTRRVMFSRPDDGPVAGSPVPSKTFGTPWYAKREGPPKTNRSPDAQLDVGVGPAAVLGVAEAEDAGVADAQRDDGRGGPLVLVLVHAHLRAAVVEVDQRGVGLVPLAGGRVPVGVDERVPAQLGQPRGEGRDAVRRSRRPRCGCSGRAASASRGTPSAPTSRRRAAASCAAAAPGRTPTPGRPSPTAAAAPRRASPARAPPPVRGAPEGVGSTRPPAPTPLATRKVSHPSPPPSGGLRTWSGTGLELR